MSELIEQAEQALREAPTYALNRETAQILSAFRRWMPDLIAELKRLEGELTESRRSASRQHVVNESICVECGGVVFWQDCPTGGWWIHEHHPADHHDAAAEFDPIEYVDDRGSWITRYPVIKARGEMEKHDYGVAPDSAIVSIRQTSEAYEVDATPN
ncbi:Uncharacterised protein [Mycobacteroides abscessus subsp. abscessus]|uniref:hypothetical protein n=1 Tax=Mycobacteroides abscessus TaxID=36809 RepID=UPI0009263BBE|nr:hypothetical protein [Mycobacteroides abscessus]SIM03138.1 Uncharacterised protein [Mycobacteroides abscessus subsp. abscessus]SLC78358.1 Uncharacterised protein [Mycobacteroides abscessus subsp. abscessus]